MQYREEAGVLWRQYVPKVGQAATVQGELIRAVERLRDEAQRNGNINWCDGHEILARYFQNTLVSSGLFPSVTVEEICRVVSRVLNFDVPEISDDPYDRLTDWVVEWARAHPDPVAHEPNPRLHC